MRTQDRLIRAVAAYPLFLTSIGAIAAPASINAPQATPAVIPAGQPTLVTFSIQVSDPDLLPGGLSLVQTDARGTPRIVVGRLNDSGTSGDKVAGDGFHSLSARVNGSGALTFAVTAAFRGLVTRMVSPTVSVLASGQASTVSAFAILTNDALSFQTASGSEQLRVPLPNQESTTNNIWQETATDARKSEYGECAAVFSETKRLDASDESADSPEWVSVSARMYCDGVSAWQRPAPPQTVYFHNKGTNLISERGESVLLVAMPTEIQAQLLVQLVSRNGVALLSLSESLREVIDAGVSSNGRFAYVQARDASGQLMVRFYDAAGGGTWSFPYDPALANAWEVAENLQGSFSVIRDGNSAFDVPVN